MACRLCSPRVMRAALRQLYRRQAAAGGPEAQGRARPALAARGHPPCAKPAVRAAAQMRKELEAGTWRGQAKDAPAAGAPGAPKPVPAPYMSVQYKEDTMRTTGAALPVRRRHMWRSRAAASATAGGVLSGGRGRSWSGGCGTARVLTRLPCRCSTRYANLLRITAASLLHTLAGTWCPLLLLQQRARPAPTSRAARRCAARRRGVAVLHVHSRGRGHQKHARAGALTPVIFDTALCSCCLCSASICGNAGALLPRARSLACSVRSAGRTSVCSIALRVPGVRAGMPGSSRPSHAQHCQR